jgi:hypothetical protein
MPHAFLRSEGANPDMRVKLTGGPDVEGDIVSGAGARKRPIPHALEPSFRCSERYLDVKRSVRRGTCPPGKHTVDIWLPA